MSLPRRHPSSAARMVSSVQKLEAFPRHMGIDLSSRKVRVTQKELDHAQICAVIDEVGGKGMPQGMRR